MYVAGPPGAIASNIGAFPGPTVQIRDEASSGAPACSEGATEDRDALSAEPAALSELSGKLAGYPTSKPLATITAEVILQAEPTMKRGLLVLIAW